MMALKLLTGWSRLVLRKLRSSGGATWDLFWKSFISIPSTGLVEAFCFGLDSLKYLVAGGAFRGEI